jgi:hypothetical protein
MSYTVLCTFWRKEKGSVADLRCLSRIPDPNFFHPESRIQGQKDSRILDPDPYQRI